MKRTRTLATLLFAAIAVSLFGSGVPAHAAGVGQWDYYLYNNVSESGTPTTGTINMNNGNPQLNWDQWGDQTGSFGYWMWFHGVTTYSPGAYYHFTYSSTKGIRVYAGGSLYVNYVDTWTSNGHSGSFNAYMPQGYPTVDVDFMDGYYAQNQENHVTVGWTIIDDGNPPSITPTITPAPNAAGWNKANPTVSWSLSDDTGISYQSGCGTQTVASETAGTTLTCGATDYAYHYGERSVTIKIDKTPPTITGSKSPAPNAAGWNKTDTTVTFPCSDALSGVASTTAPQKVTTQGKNQVVNGACTDVAGNSASTSVSVNIDETPPSTTTTPTPAVVRAAGQKISGIATDDLSGVASTSVTLTPLISGSPTTLAASCDSGCGTTSATWSVAVPDSVVAGPYTVTSASTDVAGNPETAGVGAVMVIV